MDDGKLTDLIENERAAIGHEIHDALLPLLFGASAILHREIERATKLSGESGVAGDSVEELAKATAWVDEAMQIGRQILGAAYPPELETASWDELAESTVHRVWGAAENPERVLHIDVSEEAKAIAATVATAAYRISVEAVRNAIRHGKATKVQITATRSNNTLKLSIADNGIGFDASDVAEDRYGIRSMKGRAELVGGTLRVESQPSGPTTVHFVCKMNDPKEFRAVEA